MRPKELFKKNKLKELRLARGLRQRDVAKLIGLAYPDRISHWEKGAAIPSLINLCKISILFGKSLTELYPKLCDLLKVKDH